MSGKEAGELGGTARQIEIYRRMSPARRLELGMGLNRAAREMKAAALRVQHPEWSEPQVLAAVREAFLYARS